MKTFYTELITPNKVLFKGDIIILKVSVPDGTLEVMSDHMPSICQLSTGKCTLTLPNGQKKHFGTDEGILNISGGNAILTSHFLEWEENFDKALAEMEKNIETEKKRRKQSYIEYQQSSINLKRLFVNLKGKKYNDNE